MVRRICDVNDIHFDETFTGFKFMAEKLAEYQRDGSYQYVLAFEESYGYMMGDYVRDKDAVTACVMITEMAAYYFEQGMTLAQALDALYEKYGFYGERTLNLVMPGLDGLEKMRALMAQLRREPLQEIAGTKVVRMRDYQDGSVYVMGLGKMDKRPSPARTCCTLSWTTAARSSSARPARSRRSRCTSLASARRAPSATSACSAMRSLPRRCAAEHTSNAPALRQCAPEGRLFEGKRMKEKLKQLFGLFGAFAVVGVTTFGGGYAMLPALQREVVEKRRWATEEEVMDWYAIGQCTPGVIAVNTATFVGQKQAGIWGGIFATLGVVFPSLIIIMIIAAFIQNFAHLPAVQNAFAGIRVCVCVLILNAVVKLWKKSVVDWKTFLVFLLVFAGSVFLNISPVLYVLAAAVAGIVIRELEARKA